MKYARVTQTAPQGGSWAHSPARQAKCGGKRDSKGRVAGEHERERADIRSNEELQAAWHCICHGVGRVLRTLHNVSHAGTDAGHMAAMARGHAWAGHEALSHFTATFAMAALAAGLNDLFSGVWSLAVCAKYGQIATSPKPSRPNRDGS